MLSDPSVTILMYFVLPVWFIAGFVSMAETNCARWRRESVPVGLRGKGCEALAS
jgi:hypothetical protein